MNAEIPVEHSGRILIVDDSAANLKLLTDMLALRGHTVHPASDGVSALQYARTEHPDLILLDIVMPRIDGYKVCRFLKEHEETREIPVIFMTSLAETSDKVKGFRVGAADYITKPFQSEEVMARVETLLALRAVQKKLKARNVELLKANHDLANVNKALSREIAERTQAEAELKLYREQLEDLVRERTVELAEANRHLETEIAERRRAEERVTASLREKEILLREIHHRVKNNLQIISALLHLQSDSVRDEESLSLFRVSQERIKAMALVHEKLYKSKDLASIDFGEYVENLTRHLALSYVENPDRIVVKADADSFSLDIEEAIPCGLIINELVSNALKHAFPGGCSGEITVSCHVDGDCMVTIEVRDTGVGLPSELDLLDTETLGLQIVAMLVRQLRGTIEMKSENGASFMLTFNARRGREQ